MLALTLIVPWVLGQDPDPITEIRRQAEQGDVDAQFNLGGRYFRGVGVPEDDTEAARWLRLAAEQGHAAGLCCNFGGRRRVSGDLASRHGRIVRIAGAHSGSYRSDNPICTRTQEKLGRLRGQMQQRGAVEPPSQGDGPHPDRWRRHAQVAPISRVQLGQQLP